MFRVKLASILLGTAMLASTGLSTAARADTVTTYQLTFDNSQGVAVGTGVLTLQDIPTSGTEVINASSLASDFVSLTGNFSTTPSSSAPPLRRADPLAQAFR